MSDVRPEHDEQEQPVAEAEGAEVPSAEADDEATSVESLVADLERVVGERDQYLALAQSKQAEFENYKKRMMARQADEVARAAEVLVDKLLPVLDACESAIDHGHRDVEPVFAALLGTLEKEGLTRIHPSSGEAFDPTVHEAVVHEPGDGDTVVSQVLRTGYAWKGRLLRPAMVKVRG